MKDLLFRFHETRFHFVVAAGVQVSAERREQSRRDFDPKSVSLRYRDAGVPEVERILDDLARLELFRLCSTSSGIGRGFCRATSGKISPSAFSSLSVTNQSVSTADDDAYRTADSGPQKVRWLLQGLGQVNEDVRPFVGRFPVESLTALLLLLGSR